MGVLDLRHVDLLKWGCTNLDVSELAEGFPSGMSLQVPLNKPRKRKRAKYDKFGKFQTSGNYRLSKLIAAIMISVSAMKKLFPM